MTDQKATHAALVRHMATWVETDHLRSWRDALGNAVQVGCFALMLVLMVPAHRAAHLVIVAGAIFVTAAARAWVVSRIRAAMADVDADQLLSDLTESLGGSRD